jgi:hypothetical protein
LIVAALAALPLIEQVGQGLASSVANTVSNLFSSSSTAASGQNVPSGTAPSSASSTQPSSASTLSQSVTNTLLQLQDSSSSGQTHSGRHHHHGAGSYKAASDMTSQLTGSTGSSSTPVAPTTAVTA